jgi:hypothetical protein
LGKSGLAHLTEHLTAYKYIGLADATLAGFNAWTSFCETAYEVSGLASPSLRDVGVWPVIEEFVKSLSSPDSIEQTITHSVETEQETVSQEINTSCASHESAVQTFITRTYLAENHPYRTKILGTSEDLQNITKDDIINHIHKVFNPQGLLVSAVAHEDTEPVYRELTAFLKEKLARVPRTPTYQRNQVPSELAYHRLNDISEGQYVHDTGISNNIVTITYAWVVDGEMLSHSEFARRSFIMLADQSLFRFTRNNGLSYVSRVHDGELSPSKVLVTMQFDIKSDQIEQVSNFTKKQPIIQGVFSQIDEEMIDKEVTRRSIILQARIERKRAVVDDALSGLLRVGRMINCDAVDRSRTIKKEDIIAQKDYFLDTKPVVFIVGDLGNQKGE